MLANTNIIFFNKSVGLIQTWARWARDPAIAAATEKQARLDKELQQEMARGLEDLSEPELNTHLMNIVGSEELQKLEEDARTGNASPKLYKALELVNRDPGEAAAILKQVRKSKQQ